MITENIKLSKLFKILAIDTATDACSVALYIDGEIIEEQQISPRQHTRIVLPMVDSVITKAGITLKDLDALAYGRGPGSFTGIRIVASLIQGLAYGLDKPVIPISTLRALAQGAYREQGLAAVCVHLDARLGEVYWGLFKVDQQGIMRAVSEEGLQALAQIPVPEEPFQIITGYPRAYDIASLAVQEWREGHYVQALDALPVYLRDEVVKQHPQ